MSEELMGGMKFESNVDEIYASAPNAAKSSTLRGGTYVIDYVSVNKLVPSSGGANMTTIRIPPLI